MTVLITVQAWKNSMRIRTEAGQEAGFRGRSTLG